MEINLIYTDVKTNGNEHLTILKNITSSRRFNDKYTFTYTKDSDISDVNKKYILLIISQGHIRTLVENNYKNLFIESLINKINNGFDISIVLCNEAESEYENIFDYLNTCFKNIGIPNKIVTIASGNSKLENLEQHGINCIRTFNPIVHRISPSMVFLNKPDELEWLENKKNFFQCHNNMMKPHRIGFLSLLGKENLLEKIDWSALGVSELYNLSDYSLFSLENIGLERDEIINLKEIYEKILNKGVPIFGDFEDESILNPVNLNEVKTGDPNNNETYKRNSYKNSYINIVSESQYELLNSIHITEKSLIPFYFNQLPLFVATNGHVKKLKELYGFDFFDDIIDHSYDSIENPKDRMFKIINEIKRLESNKNFIIDFYKNNKIRFENNRKIISELADIESYSIIFNNFVS